MFFRKNCSKEKVDQAREVFTRLRDDECFMQDHMFYWRIHEKLTGTVYTQIGKKVELDMDILDCWLFPEKFRRKKLTSEEAEEFRNHAVQYLESNGYTVELEYSAQNGFANRERYLGQVR